MRQTLNKTVRAIAIIVLMFSYACVVSHAKIAAVPDEEIIRAMEFELFTDEAVSGHLIDVGCTDGIVKLSGQVAHLYAKERAKTLAASIKGVRSVINELYVRPIFRSDEALVGSIRKALILDPATDMFELDVAVDHGEVRLSGTVGSWAERSLAEDVAKGIKGVKVLKNNINVVFAEVRNNSEIAADIKRRLEVDAYVNEDLLSVSVDEGVVTIQGTVGSVFEWQRVHSLAHVSGVEKIDISNVNVEDWAYDDVKRKRTNSLLSDEEIKSAVLDAFLYDPRVHAFSLAVDVENGVVTLGGVVDNLKAKKAAHRDALNTIGVMSVYNYIKVRPVNPAVDEDIQRIVIERLTLDPIIERHEIKVKVRNQKVYLYGMTDSLYEKLRTEDIASRVPGVVDIDNRLSISDKLIVKSDEELKNDIIRKFDSDNFINEDDFKVEVSGGIVTLEGTVDAWHQLNAALIDAFEAGARSVKSRIKIQDKENDYPIYHYRDYYEILL